MSADKETKKAKPAKEAKAEPAKKAAKEPKAAAGASAKQGKPARPTAPARLSIYYKETVAKELTEKFGYSSPMQVPRIEKIVLNMGVGEAVADKKIMD
ncbi:MAG: 50S ribosomal protein L5, partial [Burkholderiales bacterium]